MNALPLRRHLDALHFLEHLDAALHLRRLRRLVAEAIDELLHARDLFVLPLLRFAQPIQPGIALHDILGVVAVIVGQRAQREIGDARDDRVEEIAIVRHEDHGVRVVGEVALEPVARLEIEVIGRLVEQQQIRLAEEQLRQREAHLPAAGQVIASASRNPPARSRGRRARSRPSARSDSRRRSRTAPALRCSDAAARRVPPAEARSSPIRCSRSCISAFRSSSGFSARHASSKTERPRCIRPSCGR